MNKSPGGPNRGGDQFMGRRGPGQGPKPGLGGMMGMNYPNRGQSGGMMGWAPMMVPPRPPPPKVIELTREEVKLHKAENAWKPGSIKQPKKEDRGEPKDPDEAITDVSSNYHLKYVLEFVFSSVMSCLISFRTSSRRLVES